MFPAPRSFGPCADPGTSAPATPRLRQSSAAVPPASSKPCARRARPIRDALRACGRRASLRARSPARCRVPSIRGRGRRCRGANRRRQVPRVAAAGPCANVAAFEHDDVTPGLAQRQRRRQSRVAGANYDGVCAKVAVQGGRGGRRLGEPGVGDAFVHARVLQRSVHRHRASRDGQSRPSFRYGTRPRPPQTNPSPSGFLWGFASSSLREGGRNPGPARLKRPAGGFAPSYGSVLGGSAQYPPEPKDRKSNGPSGSYG